MKNPVIWLRISYWTGAVIDAKGAFLLVFPKAIPGLYFLFFGRSFDDTLAFRGLSITAAMMIFAWTCLLIWADRKPLERKGVLGLTICPIMFIIIIHRLLANGFSGKALPGSLLLTGVMVLFGFSYLVNKFSKHPTSTPK